MTETLAESIKEVDRLLEICNKEFLQYRKKPITIRAKQMDVPFEVETLEGTMKGKTGDYLVVGIKGERYPVDKKIFESTYSIV